MSRAQKKKGNQTALELHGLSSSDSEDANSREYRGVDKAVRRADKKFIAAQKSIETGNARDSRGGIWNKSMFNRTPTSSYGLAYQDPRNIL